VNDVGFAKNLLMHLCCESVKCAMLWEYCLCWHGCDV